MIESTSKTQSTAEEDEYKAEKHPDAFREN